MDALAEKTLAGAVTAGPPGVWSQKFQQVVIKTTFGPIVQLVGSSLLTRGAQSLDELFRHLSLDIATLKKCLLTLIQQDLVQPSYEIVPPRPGATKKQRPPRVIYTINVASVRYRTRFAAYLLYIKQIYSAECEVIMQTLLLHGKLSSKQLMDITCANINEKNRLQAQEQYKQLTLLSANGGASKAAAASAQYFPPPMPVDQRRSINEVFRKLIAARYIVRGEALTKPEDPAVVAAEAAASAAASANTDILATFRTNNAKYEKAAKEESDAAMLNAGASAAQAALKASAATAAAATTTTKKRKKIIADDDGDEDGDGAAASEDAPSSATKPARKKKKTKKELEAEAEMKETDRIAQEEQAIAAKARAEKEVQDSLDRAAAAGNDDATMTDASSANASTENDDSILWVVNHTEFLWELRKKAVVDYVVSQVGPTAGFLVQHLIALYPAEVCSSVSPERPPVYDVEAIYRICERAAVQFSVPNPVANVEIAEEQLHHLLGDSTGFFERKTHPKGYLINFPQLFNELKLKHLQSICRARFGTLAARLFRCLLIHKRLEESQLCEYAVAPRKEVRRLLYLMYNAQYISLQEVPRSSDRMPSRTFFLWGVDTTVAMTTYKESLYFAWCNLRMRLEQETDQAKPILDKVDTSKPITDAEKAAVEKWKKAADRLEAGLNQLNQLIMLFEDF